MRIQLKSRGGATRTTSFSSKVEKKLEKVAQAGLTAGGARRSS